MANAAEIAQWDAIQTVGMAYVGASGPLEWASDGSAKGTFTLYLSFNAQSPKAVECHISWKPVGNKWRTMRKKNSKNGRAGNVVMVNGFESYDPDTGQAAWRQVSDIDLGIIKLMPDKTAFKVRIRPFFQNSEVT